MRRLLAGPPRPFALAAAGLAFASAATSLFWTLGGTLLLDTVGGALEDLARERSAGALALGLATVVLKVAAGLLALALARPRRRRSRALLGLNAAAALVLVLWGGANVLVGGLVLLGAVPGPGPADERALRWHVLLWDPWFLLWGLLLALAVARARRLTRGPSAARRPPASTPR